MMFFGGGMFIIWLLVLLGIVAAFVGLSGFAARNRQDSGSPEQRQAKETPEEILRARYARGEISQAEYQEMKTTLRS